MNIDDKGWLKDVKIEKSPNFNERPNGSKINLLVIHNASLPPEVWGVEDIIALFQNKLDYGKNPTYGHLRDRKVSAHFLLDRAGAIYQLVSVFDRAWHAGVSSFAGIEDCNNYSIGIEVNGSDNQAFTEEQYVHLAELTHVLMRTFPEITLERIVGHADIALPLGRKTDPGPFFDWDYYRELLEDLLAGVQK
jgi:N-acetyl-anhydromuramoyl-L-alanine amidase